MLRVAKIGPAIFSGEAPVPWRARPSWASVSWSAAIGVLLLGCRAEAPQSDPPAAQVRPEKSLVSSQEDAFKNVPVPPADGPKLLPIALATPVREKPFLDSRTIGVLRVGAQVARSEKPVATRDCPGGWYAVRPAGFVCVGNDATLKLDHPIARAIGVEPDRSRPMPYRYAFVRSIAPNYMRVPSVEEQHKFEMRLDRHLKSYQRLKEKWDELDVGANDVPLDERGLAVGEIPEHARPLGQSERFGGNGDDSVPWWLIGERKIPNLAAFKVPAYAVISQRVKRHAGVALIGTFVAGEEAGHRRFAISTDGRLIPADKLKADSGSPFHGADIAQVGLPVAFVKSREARVYISEGTRLRESDEHPAYRSLVPLTGKVREAGGARLVEARDGRWLDSSELATVVKTSSFPGWIKKNPQAKWIDISISNQTLTLWEGTTPVYATLVSTGRDGLGEPEKTLSTPQGMFRIYQKHITTTMDSAVSDHEFELRDVPWVMYFKGGYALHGAYWHNDFGRPRSHGCVNLSPIDARYVFGWVSPNVPEHWHAAYAGERNDTGTLVYIHP